MLWSLHPLSLLSPMCPLAVSLRFQDELLMSEGTEVVSVFVVHIANSGIVEDAGQMFVTSVHQTTT